MIRPDKISPPSGDLILPGGHVGFLLIHGLGGSPVELRYLAQSLAREGYTVHCPLMTGHGGTNAALRASRWEDWYRSVQQAHDRLAETCNVIIAGGISIGAILALRLAAERPDGVQATALYAPTLWPNGWAIPRSMQLFKIVNWRWLANLFMFRELAPYGIKDERIRRFVLDSLHTYDRAPDQTLGWPGGLVMDFHRLVRDTMRTVGDVKQPALIFHPRHDDQSDLSNTMKLQRRLGGLVETVVLDDSYHMVTLDRQRGLVTERSLDFAKRIAARQATAREAGRAQKAPVQAGE